jgi:hypothetical protein
MRHLPLILLAAVQEVDVEVYRQTGQIVLLPSAYEMAGHYAGLNSSYLTSRRIYPYITIITVDQARGVRGNGRQRRRAGSTARADDPARQRRGAGAAGHCPTLSRNTVRPDCQHFQAELSSTGVGGGNQRAKQLDAPSVYWRRAGV